MRLKDRVAIVTGGAQGVGQSYVLGLAKEGAQVVVADIADAQEAVDAVRDAGGEALAVPTGVTDEESTRAMAQATLEAYGRIDILLDNAGIPGRFARTPVEEVPVELWDRIMAVNAKGIFLCAKAVLSTMKAQRSGRIFNLSSQTFYVGSPGGNAFDDSDILLDLQLFLQQKARQAGVDATIHTDRERYLGYDQPAPCEERHAHSLAKRSARRTAE